MNYFYKSFRETFMITSQCIYLEIFIKKKNVWYI